MTAPAPESVVGLHKAIWPADARDGGGSVIGGSLFDGSLSWPAMVLRDAALRHNIETLARFCREHGLAFAPHGKTTMAPAIFRRQIAAGAWGITLATAQQVAVARAGGVSRVLVAHQVLDPVALDWFAGEIAGDPDFEFACFVDSVEGVRAAGRAGRVHGLPRGFPVILDVGYSGGRTGVRTQAEARALAETIAATDGVTLIGVNGYEGGLPDVDSVHAFFATVRGVVDELADARLLVDRPIVTAGGSSYFDIVASDLAGSWAERHGATVILRSGAYVSHDDGIYTRKTAFNRVAREGDLRPALQIWAQVVSAPEAGLAIAGMGKRDAPYDSGLPIPLTARRDGGTAIDIRGRVTVPKMDDQHCYLDVPPDIVLRPGDLVCFGISHPCTAFDKWRAIPLLDEEDVILDVIRTYF
jgi:D-serine deaminase-like pyridoxal phosphate-dependent protein